MEFILSAKVESKDLQAAIASMGSVTAVVDVTGEKRMIALTVSKVLHSVKGGHHSVIKFKGDEFTAIAKIDGCGAVDLITVPSVNDEDVQEIILGYLGGREKFQEVLPQWEKILYRRDALKPENWLLYDSSHPVAVEAKKLHIEERFSSQCWWLQKDTDARKESFPTLFPWENYYKYMVRQHNAGESWPMAEAKSEVVAEMLGLDRGVKGATSTYAQFLNNHTKGGMEQLNSAIGEFKMKLDDL